MKWVQDWFFFVLSYHWHMILQTLVRDLASDMGKLGPRPSLLVYWQSLPSWSDVIQRSHSSNRNHLNGPKYVSLHMFNVSIVLI